MVQTFQSTGISGPPDRRHGCRPIGLLLLAAFFWGSGNVANKTVLDEIDPWVAVFLRCLVAALVLWPLALHESRRPGSSLWFASSLVPSGHFDIALVLQQHGYVTATVTNASFLVNAACVLTPHIAFLIFREAPGRPVLVAALIMFTGAFVMSGAGSSLARVTPGDLLCLLSAAVYAAWAIALGRHDMRHGRPVATTLTHCLVAAAVTLPAAVLTWPTNLGLPVGALPEVLYLGVFSTAAAFVLMVMAQATVSASVASVIVAAESVFGAAGGMVLLGERPGLAVLAGAALMIGAIFLIGAFPSRRYPPQPDPGHTDPPQASRPVAPAAYPLRPPFDPVPRRGGTDVMTLIALGRSRMPPRPPHHPDKEIQR